VHGGDDGTLHVFCTLCFGFSVSLDGDTLLIADSDTSEVYIGTGRMQEYFDFVLKSGPVWVIKIGSVVSRLACQDFLAETDKDAPVSFIIILLGFLKLFFFAAVAIDNVGIVVVTGTLSLLVLLLLSC
jgi:hypothetical protein